MKQPHNPMLNPLACCEPIKLTARNSPITSGRGKMSSATIARQQPAPPLGEIARLQVGPLPWELPQH